ncbi:MAG TPA: glycosyltransferase family 4 protein [Bellilinea sp.]|jgi:glycosyltransferase involved in cell wall biosynthesis|nr:glycosyltransferase family 4 protein [Bellilinea sp.]
MKAALIYLGRRGAGPAFSLDIARCLQPYLQVRAYLSQHIEHAERWAEVEDEAVFFEVFSSPLQAAWRTLSRQNIRAIAAQVRAYQPDVLIFPMFHPWNPLLQAALKDIPAIVFVHDPLPHPGFGNRLLRYWEDRSLHLAAGLVVFSESFLPAIAARGGKPENTRVVPLPVNASLPADRAEELSIEPVDFLFIGRITSYKGLEVLLKAFEQVSAQRTSATLRIAGRGDLRPYQELLRKLPNIDLCNIWIDEGAIPAYIRASKVVVLPYTSATQSGIVPLAASVGAAVLATRTGGLPEQIEHGVNGWLVEPNNAEQLSAAMLRLLDDAPLRTEIGTALNQEYANKRNWKHVAQGLMELIGNILPSDQSGGAL